jgi:hypothetical protein
MPSITTLQFGTKLGPAELNAFVQSTGPQNPPIANLVYLDQNGNSVGNGTILPVGADTITAQYGPYALPVSQTFNVTSPPSLSSPSLTRVTAAAITIQTSVNGAPTLSVTTLLAGGNRETGTIAFTLHIVPQNTALQPYIVVPSSENVHGDGLYSASYTIPAGMAGNYTWAAIYSGDASNNPVGSTKLGTVTVQTPSVYATLDGVPITQYWAYSQASINDAAIWYHVDLAQPIGYFGTNPASPPPAIATGNGQLFADWVGPTYGQTNPTTGVSPVAGSPAVPPMQISIPRKITVSTVVSTEVSKTVPVKVTYSAVKHGHTVQVTKFIKEKILVRVYKSVRETVWTAVNRFVRAYNPEG